MKRNSVIVFLIILLSLPAWGATLTKVRFGYYPEKIRVVLDLDQKIDYQAETSSDKIEIILPNSEAGLGINSYYDVNDVVIRYIQVERKGSDLKVTIPMLEPVTSQVFSLATPDRIIVDLGRNFTKFSQAGEIAKGIKYLEVKKGTKNGRVNAKVLQVDLEEAQVLPAMPLKAESNPISSFLDFINPFKGKAAESRAPRLAKTSDIVDQNRALAGINGTYYSSKGTPLGALMISKELISSPIYNRTALILSSDNKAYIDNIDIKSSFTLKSGTKVGITGVNEGRGNDSVILYTKRWGKATGTKENGFEIIVRNNQIEKTALGNSEIPEDGFVISIQGPMLEVIPKQINVGDEIKTSINVIPYATYPQGILHIMGGGPRLLKRGKIYVSKQHEKFRSDIARGRAARTAVGINKKGELLLVTVDGLPKDKWKKSSPDASIGVTLEELSQFMLDLGAVEALNLDGGSSTTMVVHGRVVNEPTSGYQKSISNVLVVKEN